MSDEHFGVEDCVFCRIVAGELPSEEVASTPSSYAFRDIHPAAPTHVLVVPRSHVTNAAAISAHHGSLLVDLLDLANRVAGLEGLAERGYRLVLNVGDDALNSVPHLHLHVLGGRRLGAMG